MKNNTPKKMTVIELAAFLRETIPPGISETMIYNHIRRAGLKIDTRKRVNVAEFLNAYMQSKERDNKNTLPAGIDAGQDPKRYKTVLECYVLKAKLDQIKGELVPLEEVKSTLAQHAGIVNNIFDQWIQYVETITRDALLVEKARELENSMRARIREKVEKVK